MSRHGDLDTTGGCDQPCVCSVPTVGAVQFSCPKAITAVLKSSLGWLMCLWQGWELSWIIRQEKTPQGTSREQNICVAGQRPVLVPPAGLEVLGWEDDSWDAGEDILGAEFSTSCTAAQWDGITAGLSRHLPPGAHRAAAPCWSWAWQGVMGLGQLLGVPEPQKTMGDKALSCPDLCGARDVSRGAGTALWDSPQPCWSTGSEQGSSSADCCSPGLCACLLLLQPLCFLGMLFYSGP